MTLELTSPSKLEPKKLKSKKSKTESSTNPESDAVPMNVDINGDNIAHPDLSAEKKEKKKEKKKKNRQTALGDRDIESGTGTSTPTTQPDDPLDAHKKKKSKDRKKRKVEELSDPSATSLAERLQNDPMQVDEPEPTKEKKEKKEKKRKHRTHEQGGEAVLDQDASVVPTEGEGPSKKAKKLKRDHDLATAESEAATDPSTKSKSEKKDKKSKKEKGKKEKKERAIDIVESSVTTTENTPTTSTSSVTSPSSSVPSTPPSEDEISTYLSKNAITIHTPPSSSIPFSVCPVLSFSQLRIPEELRGALKGFKEPTPIQACSWPVALEGKDVVGVAETGSGKTLAFGLPALAHLISSEVQHNKPRVLVVAPTRELAIQTHDTLFALGEPFGIKSVAVFGGVDKASQIQALRSSASTANKKSKQRQGDSGGAKIVVGTPGRILDLVNDGVCDLSEVEYLVLDEADRMLDSGFENDIRSIIGYTKPISPSNGKESGRQTLMFSATWPEGVRRLAGTFLKEPVRVVVGSDDLSANRRVEQVVEVFDDSRSKDSRLLGHLKRHLPRNSKPSEPLTLILIFALYKKEASRVESMLRSKGFSVGGLHGDLSQPARMQALQKFKSGETRLLVATDVAARGLDIPNVEMVINYTFPLTVEDYVHRIGRTGRGGKHGKSITFFTGDGHERGLAGELARVLRESGHEGQAEGLKKFPMTIKKKTHSAYGAFFREDIPTPAGPTKITFD